MTDNWQDELFRVVLSRLSAGRGAKKSRGEVWDAIYAAHNGRPDGYLVTNDNQHLFRLYRNNVSPNPDHLIDAALKYQKQEVV